MTSSKSDAGAHEGLQTLPAAKRNGSPTMILVQHGIRWTALAAMFALRLVPALWIAGHPERALFPDSFGYMALAAQIHAGESYHLEDLPGMDLMRPPGYPALLAGLAAVGLGSASGIVLVQLLIGWLVVWAVCSMAEEVGGRQSGRVAGLLYYAWPNAVLWAMAALSDMPFTLLTTLGAWAMLRSRGSRRLLWPALAGLLAGAACLTRPIGVLLVPLWAGSLLILGSSRLPAWRRLAPPVVFVVLAGSFVLPWAMRNRHVHGMFAVSNIDVVNLGEYMAPAALARGQSISLDQARELLPLPPIPMAADRIRYLKVIGSYPVEYLAAHARGTWTLLTEAGQPNLGILLGERYRSAGVLVALRKGDPGGAGTAFLKAMEDPILRWFTLVPWFGMAVQSIVYVLGGAGYRCALEDGRRSALGRSAPAADGTGLRSCPRTCRERAVPASGRTPPLRPGRCRGILSAWGEEQARHCSAGVRKRHWRVQNCRDHAAS